MGVDRGLEILSRLVRLQSDAGDIEIANTDATGKLSATLGASAILELFAGTDKVIDVAAGLKLKIETKTATTADATETLIWNRAVPTSGCVGALAFVVAKHTGANADGLVAVAWNACTNNAGTTAILNATDGGSVIENASGSPTTDFDVNNTADTIELNVTGIAAQTYKWTAIIASFEVV